MPKFRNVSPLGALDLALAGRTIQAGEEFELTPGQAKFLEGQESIWQPVTAGAPTIDELKEQLRTLDLPVSGTKAELVDRLADAIATQPTTSTEETRA